MIYIVFNSQKIFGQKLKIENEEKLRSGGRTFGQKLKIGFEEFSLMV